ncbi:unnamed protein product [Effrenium voratum]|nr:unnamed protein product [Effrenium voratum]
MPGKRRFQAKDLVQAGGSKKAREEPLGKALPDALVAIARPWGGSFWVFEGEEVETPLWQVQINGAHRDAFSAQALLTAREALQCHNTRTRT